MNEQELNNSSNIIGKGTQLEGNLTTLGNLRVEGKIKGSIQTKAKVVLGDTAIVEGDILAQNAEIGGEVHGTIRVAGLLNLKPTALVHGDIVTSKLIFEEGARFNGKCNMGGNVKESKASLDLKEDSTKIPATLDPTPNSKLNSKELPA